MVSTVSSRRRVTMSTVRLSGSYAVFKAAELRVGCVWWILDCLGHKGICRLVLSFGVSDNHGPHGSHPFLLADIRRRCGVRATLLLLLGEVVGKIVRAYSLEHGIFRTEKRLGTEERWDVVYVFLSSLLEETCMRLARR